MTAPRSPHLPAVLLTTATLLLCLAVPARGDRVSSTAYCLRGVMADGRSVYWGAVASNRHRLGTLIRLTRAVHRKRWFRVRDRIGHGSQLDVWMPTCGMAIQWGRRVVSYEVMGR
jgi:hypothetical protein